MTDRGGRRDPATLDADPPGVRPRRARLRRRLGVVSALALAAVAVAGPVTARRELAYSQDRLAAAHQRAAGARAGLEAEDQRLTAAAQQLTGLEAEAVSAARTVADARARLATTGVSEADLRETLAETQRRLDDAAAARDQRQRLVVRLDAQLPHVKECVADTVRSLAVAARTTDPDLSASPACRAAADPG